MAGAEQFAWEAVSNTLGVSSDVDSCVTLSEPIVALMDQAHEFFRNEGAGIACRAGCSFCCHLRVMVYPHEAIALFRHLGSRMPPDQAATVRERLRGEAAHRGCAFLVEGRCSAYDVRPAACSGYHSLSRENCEKAFQAGGASPEGTPVLQGLSHVASALDSGMSNALHACGLDGTQVELQGAVAALLRDPGLIQRWRSGRRLLRRDSRGRS